MSPLRIVNRTELAQCFQVSLPTIDSWVRSGCPYLHKGSKGREWQFDMRAVFDWRHEYKKLVEDPEKLSPSERKAWYQAEILKHQLRERDAKLIVASEARMTVLAAYAVIQSEVAKMIDTMPTECREAVAEMLRNGVEGFCDQMVLAGLMDKSAI